MFHICLTRHAAITVGGMEMETYHPGSIATKDVSYEMRDLFLSMFPHIANTSNFGPLAHQNGKRSSRIKRLLEGVLLELRTARLAHPFHHE